MTTPPRLNRPTPRAGSSTSSNNWWHIGSLDGTSTILVRTSDGFCWAALANGNGIDLDSMVWEMVTAVGVGNWPAGEPL